MADNKQHTEQQPVTSMPLQEEYHVSLIQHIGVACTPLVRVGEKVGKGQCIGDGPPGKSVPIHAPTSGTIAAIGLQRDPRAGWAQCIVIRSDGTDTWSDGRLTKRNFDNMTPAAMRAIIRDCGVVGMGGAAFPAHVKLSPPPHKPIDILIVNAAECEPYLTSDYRLMLESPEQIIRGCRIMMKILDVSQCFIGVEDNKKSAIALLTKNCGSAPIRIVSLPTKYPQGGEKMLVKAITGRDVGCGKLPLEAGCVVHNVATVKAVCDAVEWNVPLIERIVTVSGPAVARPGNVLARTGTRFAACIAHCGGYVSSPSRILMGGPMMGVAQADDNAPVVKACSGILAFSKEGAKSPGEGPCIRCGRCVAVCPMGLRPFMLSIAGERRKYEAALLDYDLLDCVECGCCAFVCPARRNIVQYVRLSKAKNALKNTSLLR